MPTSILWRRLDQEGHEVARLSERPSAWLLSGTVVFVSNGSPCRLEYRVTCGRDWKTLGATVEGWRGTTNIDLSIEVDQQHRWWLNGRECPAVAGCLDLDLSFSPSTNLLPIRRLALQEGELADVRAAWLRVPDMMLAPLEQRYWRLDATMYRYTSDGGRFATNLVVRDDGFVTTYPGLWEEVTGSSDSIVMRAVGAAPEVTPHSR